MGCRFMIRHSAFIVQVICVRSFKQKYIRSRLLRKETEHIFVSGSKHSFHGKQRKEGVEIEAYKAASTSSVEAFGQLIA